MDDRIRNSISSTEGFFAAFCFAFLAFCLACLPCFLPFTACFPVSAGATNLVMAKVSANKRTKATPWDPLLNPMGMEHKRGNHCNRTEPATLPTKIRIPRLSTESKRREIQIPAAIKIPQYPIPRIFPQNDPSITILILRVSFPVIRSFFRYYDVLPPTDTTDCCIAIQFPHLRFGLHSIPVYIPFRSVLNMRHWHITPY